MNTNLLKAIVLGLSSISLCICSFSLFVVLAPLTMEIQIYPGVSASPALSILTGLTVLGAAVAVMLSAIGTWFFFLYKPGQKVNEECEASLNRLREFTLQTYFDQITGLLVEKNLRVSEKGSKAQNTARQLTLSVLPQLSSDQKGKLLSFLNDLGLITDDTVIDLNQADLSGANLRGLKLIKADLTDANLNGADLSGADLTGAKISTQQLKFVKSLNGAILPGDY